MCPVKYAGKCRTISQAAERAGSLASGAITSGDLGLSLPFSCLAIFGFLLAVCLFFSPSVFDSSLPVSLSSFHELHHSRDEQQQSSLTDTHFLCAHVFMSFMYLRTIRDFNLYLCVRTCPSVGTWSPRRLNPSGTSDPSGAV